MIQIVLGLDTLGVGTAMNSDPRLKIAPFVASNGRTSHCRCVQFLEHLANAVLPYVHNHPRSTAFDMVEMHCPWCVPIITSISREKVNVSPNFEQKTLT